MTDPQRNGPIVPGELTDRIVDFLHDDWPSLASCAMVNSLSALSPRAKFHLSHTITILVQHDSSTLGLSHFLRLFGPSTQLAPVVQSLHIRARDTLSPSHASGLETFSSGPTLPPFADLRHLPHLRSLVLSDLHIGLPGRFIHFLCSIPALEELSCLNLRSPAYSSSYRTIPDRARPLPSAYAALRARLRVLCIVGTDPGLGREDGIPYDCLAEILGLSDSPNSDLSLDLDRHSGTHLSLCSADIHFPDVRRSERWIRAICFKSCTSLTGLSVTIASAVHTQSDADDDWNRLFAVIAACTALQSLNICYNPQALLRNLNQPLLAPSQRANTYNRFVTFLSNALLVSAPGTCAPGSTEMENRASSSLSDSSLPMFAHLNTFKLVLRASAPDVLYERPDIAPFSLLTDALSPSRYTDLREVYVQVEAVPTYTYRPTHDGGVQEITSVVRGEVEKWDTYVMVIRDALKSFENTRVVTSAELLSL